MAQMPSKTGEAFLVAGAPEEKARGAAEAIAAHESRFASPRVTRATIEGFVTPGETDLPP
jgi:hypothetical protein